MWVLLFFAVSAFSSEELDLEAVRILDEQLPSSTHIETDEELEYSRQNLKYRPPYRKVTMAKIVASEIEYGYIREGKTLIGVEDNKAHEVTESFYAKFFRLEDEQGFKYVQSNDGKCIYKMLSKDFVSIQPELLLYEPPLRYTPAPKNIVRSEFDKKLKLRPEVSFYAGIVRGTYMKDLFNDEKASTGFSTQYAAHLTTDWSYPIKPGLVVHYEQTNYDLSGGGQVNYSALSLGPQFKSKDFDLNGFAVRLQTQIRVSPMARADAEASRGDVSFKFNSTDALISAEHPIKNGWGEFVLGIFFQQQWLNIKDQSEIVRVNTSNETNKSFGLNLAQVFP